MQRNFVRRSLRKEGAIPNVKKPAIQQQTVKSTPSAAAAASAAMAVASSGKNLDVRFG